MDGAEVRTLLTGVAAGEVAVAEAVELLAMLNSCAPGVVVCTIDNGFGADVLAVRVARRAASSPMETAR